MKVAITGHTQGIGKALYEVFSNNSHKVTGFSISNGYDISQNTNTIVETIKDYDVFINNAYHQEAQYDLLEKVYSLWAGRETKSIINISSKQSRRDLDWSQDYINAKRKQNNFIDLQITRAYPKILNVMPGLVDTDMSKILKAEHRADPKEVATLIYTLWSHPTLHIQEVTFDALGLDWKDIRL